jgi:protein TonB
MIVTALTNRSLPEGPRRPKPEASPSARPRLVFIPPAPLRPVPPPPAQPQPRPDVNRLQPVPTPPPQRADNLKGPLHLPRPEDSPSPPPTTLATRQKDKISIGTATGTENVFVAPKAGVPGPPKDGRPGAPNPAQAPEEQGNPEQSASTDVTGARRQKANRGVGENPVAPEERSIAGSIRRLERRMVELAPSGEGGAVRQMGPLLFDDEGADFTAWINHWRTEVYRNWIVPQAVLFGFRSGHVDFEFTVERDGTMSALRMLKTSGVPALDRAAENALRGSRMLALPGDYRPARVTMQVTFIYNEKPPQGS